MKDGHFYKQGKFVSASFPTPLLVFQITSLVTGLYFQNQISEQLSIINKKLDFFECEDLLEKGEVEGISDDIN